MSEISRREFVKSSATAGVALSAGSLSRDTLARDQSDRANAKKPNVVLICSDMAAARHFGCYGDPAKVTPNVDALAQRGVRFDQGYCASAPCIPARASMMTGQYAHTHGKTAHLKMELQPCPPLLPEILSRHGYQTAIVGKTHWWPANDKLGADRAFLTIDDHLTAELGEDDAYVRFLIEEGIIDKDRWEEERRRVDPNRIPERCLKVNWTGDKACSLIREFSAGEGPFFVYCSFVEPHGGGSTPKEHLAKLADRPMRPIIGREGEHENKPEVQKEAVRRYAAGMAKIDQYRRRVYASLNLVDENVGKIVETLDSLDHARDTYVVFLTDHGDLMGDHGLREKTFLYDSAVKIPYIIRGPGIPQGHARPHLVSQVDLLPTILECCGIEEIPPRIEGRSVLPIVADPNAPWRQTLFCEADQTVHLRGAAASSQAKMLRTGPWKYIYTLVEGHVLEEEVYHLQDDPDELHNLAHDPEQAERIEGFRSELLRRLVAGEVNRLHPVPESHYPVPTIDRRLF